MEDMIMTVFLTVQTGDGPISRASGDIMTEVRVLFGLAAAGGAVFLGFWMRKFTLLIGWIAVCMLIGVFVWDPQFVGEGGVSVAKHLFGGWLSK